MADPDTIQTLEAEEAPARVVTFAPTFKEDVAVLEGRDRALAYRALLAFAAMIGQEQESIERLGLNHVPSSRRELATLHDDAIRLAHRIGTGA